MIPANAAGGYRLIAVTMPNAETRGRTLDSWVVTVAEVDKRTGLIFFPDLDRAGPRGTDIRSILEDIPPASMP